MKAKLVKNQNRAAWMVEWQCFPHDSRLKEQELRPYMLPYRWKDGRVFDYMRCVFWNSGRCAPSDTLRGINTPYSGNTDPKGAYRENEGARLFYGLHGDACLLVAGLTNTLCIATDETGKVVVKWTRPAGARRDDAIDRIVQVGEPVERQWIWKAGRWFSGNNAQSIGELDSGSALTDLAT